MSLIDALHAALLGYPSEKSLELKVFILERKESGDVVLETNWRNQCAALAAQSHLSVTCDPCSSGELGFRDVAPHGLGAILVYRLSSSACKEPGISPGA